jgi:hypothetical protein
MTLAILTMAISLTLGIYSLIYMPYWVLGVSFAVMIGLVLLSALLYDVIRVYWLGQACDVLAIASMLIFATILAPEVWMFAFAETNTVAFILAFCFASAATVFSLFLWLVGAFALPESIFLFFLESGVKDEW